MEAIFKVAMNCHATRARSLRHRWAVMTEEKDSLSVVVDCK